jgi:hypothetical protein
MALEQATFPIHDEVANLYITHNRIKIKRARMTLLFYNCETIFLKTLTVIQEAATFFECNYFQFVSFPH